LFIAEEFLDMERSGVLPKGRDEIDLAFARSPEWDLAFARTPELKEVEYDHNY